MFRAVKLEVPKIDFLLLSLTVRQLALVSQYICCAAKSSKNRFCDQKVAPVAALPYASTCSLY